MLKLKLDIFPALAVAVNVKVAITELPGFNTVFVRSHDNVKYVFAFDGVQLDDDILNVIGTLPLFLI
jgi:hypothetical protein